MNRYITFLTDEDNDIQCMSEAEFRAAARPLPSWAEWVWQYADSHDQAVDQHFEKMEAYERNPNLETY